MFESLRWIEPDEHVAEDDLLLYADGELSPRKAAKLQEHLEGCWPCRVRAEKYQQIISQLVDYVNLGLTTSQPPPPNSWRYFPAQLHKAGLQPKKAQGVLTLAAVLARKALLGRGFHLASGTAVILLLLILFSRFLTPPAVSGSELLRKSAGAELQSLRKINQPVVYQKLRIRTGRKSFTREIWRDASNHRSKDSWQGPSESDKSVPSGLRGAEAVSPEVNDLRSIFASNSLFWDDPLSAQSYSNWCSSAGLKSEEIVRESDRITLKTSIVAGLQTEGTQRTGGDKVVAANLILRTSDLHPISETLYIESPVDGKQSQRQVELAEISYDVVPLSALGASLFDSVLIAPTSSTASTHLAVAGAAVLTDPSHAELIDSEVAARFALHQVAADLGLPITFRILEQQRHPAVVVEGVVQSQTRKQELVRVLSGIPYIKVDLKAEEEVSAQASPAVAAAIRAESAEVNVARPHSPIEKQLVAYFQSQEAVEAFSEQTFASTESLMAHAWALRHLSERYANIKATTPSSLRPSSQKLMETMIRDLRDGMRTDVIALTKALEPVLFSSANASPATNEALPIFDSAYRVERLTFYLLFGVQAVDSEQDKSADAARELLMELQRLRYQLQPEE